VQEEADSKIYANTKKQKQTT